MALPQTCVHLQINSIVETLFVLLYQFDQAELLGHMERLAHGGLPRDAVGMRGWAATAKEVDAERVARPRRTPVNRAIRNFHRGVPDVLLGIDLRGDRKT